MAPTLRPSDLLLVAPVGRAGGAPRRGTVVVLRRGGVRMVKRVVGVAGDRVELEAGRLSVDGRPVDGSPHVRGALTRTWQVPAGHLFVAGDNGGASDDSRVWAEPFVPLSDVEARVVARLPRLVRAAARAARAARRGGGPVRPRPGAAAPRAARS